MGAMRAFTILVVGGGNVIIRRKCRDRNAQQPVKDAADYITATNDEDGLIQVIGKFFV